MRGVIKSVEASGSGAVRRLYAPRAPTPAAPMLDPIKARLHDAECAIADLQSELRERGRELADAKTHVEEAFKAGVAEGRAQGLREADDANQQRFELLAVGVGGAVDVFKAELAALERLAPKLAQAALGKLISHPETRRELFAETIVRQLGTLERASILSIEVSRADFADPLEATQFARGLDAPELEVRTSDDIAPGGCRIKLKLGYLEVGLDQQWSELDRLLERLSEPLVRA